jgi:hypothetical protein
VDKAITDQGKLDGQGLARIFPLEFDFQPPEEW